MTEEQLVINKGLLDAIKVIQEMFASMRTRMDLINERVSLVRESVDAIQERLTAVEKHTALRMMKDPVLRDSQKPGNF